MSPFFPIPLPQPSSRAEAAALSGAVDGAGSAAPRIALCCAALA